MTSKLPQPVSTGAAALSPSASLPSLPRRRIPAWERFGLKLKKNVASVNGVYAAEDSLRKRKEHDRAKDEMVNGKSRDEKDAPPAKKRLQKAPPPQAAEEASFLSSEPSRQIASAQAAKPTDNMSDGAAAGATAATAPMTTPAKNEVSAPKKRRKGVTFTPDTKQTDGHSAQLFMRANPSGQQPIALPWHDVDWPTANEEELVGQVSSEQGDTTPDPKLQRKKEKKEKRKKNKQANREAKPTGDSATGSSLTGHSGADTLVNPPYHEARSPAPPLHAALQYLDQYQRLRSQWKFNKARQSYLLKHLLDFGRIPARWDDALCLYITGLQGEGVRARVRAAMEERIAASATVGAPSAPDDKASPAYIAWLNKVRTAVQHAHEQLRHNQATTTGENAAPNAGEGGLRDDGADGEAGGDPAVLRELDVVTRAEAILRALYASKEGGVMAAASNGAKPVVARAIDQHKAQQQEQKGGPGLRQLGRRKRKLRTNAVELSSSEDDTASDSSSSSDSDSGGDKASSSGSSTTVDSESTTSSNNTTLGGGSDRSGEDAGSSGAEDSNAAVEGSSESSEGSTAIDPSTDGDDDSSTAIDASSDGSDGGDDDDSNGGDDDDGNNSDDDATIAIRKDGSSGGGGSSRGSSDGSDSSDGHNDSGDDARAGDRGCDLDSDSDSGPGPSPDEAAHSSTSGGGDGGHKKGRRMKSRL